MSTPTADQAAILARLIALARIGLGVAATFAPRLTGRALLADTDGTSAEAVRMLGGRDAALGVGALLAARRGTGALRGWVEAGALADAVDAVAFATSRRTSPMLRGFTILVAGGSAVVSVLLARRLGGAADEPTGRGGPT